VLFDQLEEVKVQIRENAQKQSRMLLLQQVEYVRIRFVKVDEVGNKLKLIFLRHRFQMSAEDSRVFLRQFDCMRALQFAEVWVAKLFKH